MGVLEYSTTLLFNNVNFFLYTLFVHIVHWNILLIIKYQDKYEP